MNHMQKFIFFGFVAVAILTLSTGTAAVAANDDPLVCLCIPVNDVTAQDAAEAWCEAATLTDGYGSDRLRNPRSGEVQIGTGYGAKIPANVGGCTEWINGTYACSELVGGSPGIPREPKICAGSPAM